jgi:hypothetical protein
MVLNDVKEVLNALTELAVVEETDHKYQYQWYYRGIYSLSGNQCGREKKQGESESCTAQKDSFFSYQDKNQKYGYKRIYSED